MKIVRDKECEPEPDTAELAVKKSSYQDCRHMQTVIDRELRTVTCRRCGEKLDPIQVLINIHTYVEGVRAQAARLDEYRKQQRAKAKERRMKCRRCKKLFKPEPQQGEFGPFYGHWGICDPCWAKNPKHEEVA